MVNDPVLWDIVRPALNKSPANAIGIPPNIKAQNIFTGSIRYGTYKGYKIPVTSIEKAPKWKLIWTKSIPTIYLVITIAQAQNISIII